MADYSQINDYSAKDALATGNPLKLIKGSDVDAEFAAISTAIASKFDSTDIATAGEAQAGTSNTVVITPARLTAWGQNAAGVIEDIQALADPGADRLLMWDESANATVFASLGTGLAFTGTVLDVDVDGGTFGNRTLTAGLGLSGGGDLSADRTFDLDLSEIAVTVPAVGDFLIYHDASASLPGAATITNVNAAFLLTGLGDYDANDHIDHTAVTLTAGEGLTGGGDISANRTFDMDINGLTVETTLAGAADYAVFYDASAAAHRKVLLGNLVGDELGDGKWYRNTTQALSAATEATVAFNTAEYDSLTKGTFNTSTGEYTSTAGGRIWIATSISIAAMNDDESMELEVQVNGVTKLRSYIWNDSDNDTPEYTINVQGPLSLAASDVVRVRMTTSTAETISAGTQNSFFGIMELS